MNDEFKIGFEFEFFCGIERPKIVKMLKDRYKSEIESVYKDFKQRWQKVDVAYKRLCKMEWRPGCFFITNDPSLWLDEYEIGSLFNDKVSVYKVRHELITPPLKDSIAMEVLRVTLDWIREYGYTNITCGLHVNISFRDKTLNRAIDTVCLSLNVNEGARDRFSRGRNHFCKSVQSMLFMAAKRVEKKMQNDAEESFDDSFVADVVDCIREEFESSLTYRYNSKYYLNNLAYLQDYGYVESRMIGGMGYERKIKDINKTIEEMLRALRASVDGDPCTNSKVRRYVKDFYRWIV